MTRCKRHPVYLGMPIGLPDDWQGPVPEGVRIRIRHEPTEAQPVPVRKRPTRRPAKDAR